MSSKAHFKAQDYLGLKLIPDSVEIWIIHSVFLEKPLRSTFPKYTVGRTSHTNSTSPSSTTLSTRNFTGRKTTF